MVGVIVYFLVELLNYYLAYRYIFRIPFTKNKYFYLIDIICACMIETLVLMQMGQAYRDLSILVVGLLAILIVTKSKRWKVFLLYPVVFFLTSMINTLGSYGLAALLGIAQEEVCNSAGLTLIAECTAIIVFLLYEKVVRKKNTEEVELTMGQYLILLVGSIGTFLIVGFSQGLLRGEIDVLHKNKELIAVVSTVVAIFFIGLSIWQHITWKKAFQYKVENEKYKMFLSGQEKHIHMLIYEDEKRRKLHHDMNAHMVALDNMVINKDWVQLKKYISQMKQSLDDVKVDKYTTISAVDAIISEWHERAITHKVEWSWRGTLHPLDRVSVYELCIVFSNLLSNAVEELEKGDKGGKLDISVSNFQGKIVISIKNTCRDTVTCGDLKTTKGDKRFHGLGLKNVKEIIEKHEGSIEYSIVDNRFQVDVIL